MSLILNLQFWNGDKAQAMALARLIADIEPSKRDDVSFLFSARFDTQHDWDAVEYIKGKFAKVYTFTSRNQGTGWPRGPNALFSDSYQFCIERTRDRTIDATGILFMEADCLPLDIHWINHLKAEWDSCLRAGKRVLGCWLEEGDCGVRHINGNCIIHKDFWRDNKQILNPGEGGWDALAAPVMLPEGMASRLIYSDYGLGKPGYNDWKGCDYLFTAKRYRDAKNPLFGQDVNPVWLHGPKLMAGIDCVRSKFFSK